MKTTPTLHVWRRVLRAAAWGVVLVAAAPAVASADPIVTTLPTVTIRVSLRRIGLRASALTFDPATGLLVPVAFQPMAHRSNARHRWPPLRLDPDTGLMRPAFGAAEVTHARARGRAFSASVHLDPATGLMVPVAFNTPLAP